MEVNKEAVEGRVWKIQAHTDIFFLKIFTATGSQ